MTTSVSDPCSYRVDELACGHEREEHSDQHEGMAYSVIIHCVECWLESIDWYNAHLPCTTCNPPGQQALADGTYPHTPCWDVEIREAFATHPHRPSTVTLAIAI